MQSIMNEAMYRPLHESMDRKRKFQHGSALPVASVSVSAPACASSGISLPSGVSQYLSQVQATPSSTSSVPVSVQPMMQQSMPLQRQSMNMPMSMSMQPPMKRARTRTAAPGSRSVTLSLDQMQQILSAQLQQRNSQAHSQVHSQVQSQVSSQYQQPQSMMSLPRSVPVSVPVPVPVSAPVSAPVPPSILKKDVDISSNSSNLSQSSDDSNKSVSFGKITITQTANATANDAQASTPAAALPQAAATATARPISSSKQEISLDDYEAARLLVPPNSQIASSTKREKQLMLRLMILTRQNEIKDIRSQVKKMKEEEEHLRDMLDCTARNIMESRERLSSMGVHLPVSGQGQAQGQVHVQVGQVGGHAQGHGHGQVQMQPQMQVPPPAQDPGSINTMSVEEIVNKVLAAERNRGRFGQ